MKRSKFVKYIHDNGLHGIVLGLNFYELDGVRIGDHSEVNSKLREWGYRDMSFLVDSFHN